MYKYMSITYALLVPISKELVFESGIGLESKVLLLIFPNEPRAMMNLLFAHF